jgi:hypothetical protein
VPESARNLIRRLLVQEPDARLGAETNEKSYAELRVSLAPDAVCRTSRLMSGEMDSQEHPFFVGIDWENLHQMPSPYTPPTIELPEPKTDGAMENWTVAEYFFDDGFSESTDDLMSMSSRRSRSSSSMRHGRPSCISPDELVRMEAKVKIHSKMLSRTRQVRRPSRRTHPMDRVAHYLCAGLCSSFSPMHRGSWCSAPGRANSSATLCSRGTRVSTHRVHRLST